MKYSSAAVKMFIFDFPRKSNHIMMIQMLSW